MGLLNNPPPPEEVHISQFPSIDVHQEPGTWEYVLMTLVRTSNSQNLGWSSRDLSSSLLAGHTPFLFPGFYANSCAGESFLCMMS